jgi:hypothetical protein
MIKYVNSLDKKIYLTSGLPFFKWRINMHNHLKTKIMKFVKLSVLALSLGLFVASCGNSSETTTTTDSTTTTAPVAEPTPAPADTMTAAPAKPDSAATTTTTTTTTEEKKK